MGYKWGQGHTPHFLLWTMRIWSQNWIKLSQRWTSLILLSAMSNSMGSLVVLFLQEICFYRRIFTFSYLFTWTLLCTLRNTITEGSKESEMYSLELSYFHFYPVLCLPWYFVNLDDFQEHSKFWGDVWKPWDNREKDVIKLSVVQPQTAFISPWRRLFGCDGRWRAPGRQSWVEMLQRISQWMSEAGVPAFSTVRDKGKKHLQGKMGFFPVLYLSSIWLCVISEASNSLSFACIRMSFSALPAQHFFIWTCE